MIEEKRKARCGDPSKEANVWLDKIADVHRRRRRAQNLAVDRTPELRRTARQARPALEETRETAKREPEALRNRKEEVEDLERERDVLLEQYADMVLEGSKVSARGEALGVQAPAPQRFR